MIIFNFIGPVLANKFGVRKILVISCIFTIVGYLLMMTYNSGTSVMYMILTQIVRAIGAGLGLMPSVTWTIAVVSGDVEDATAINNTIRQIRSNWVCCCSCFDVSLCRRHCWSQSHVNICI